MLHVQNENDLQRLKQSVQPAYFAVVSDWFNYLKQSSPCLGLGIPFVLDSGSIHVVVKGDRGACLQPLFASWVEYAELLHTEGGNEVWKIAVSLDNDWIDCWFVPRRLAPELDSWADQYLDKE